MTFESLADNNRSKFRFLYSSVPKPVIVAYVIAMTLLYIIVRVHTPTAVYPSAPHDDTLFMALGQYLAEGTWFGPYNEFTLVKGPGYPVFLAVSYWLGLPISLTTAVFHCFATTFIVVICHRFIKSYLLSGLFLALLLWHPVALSIYLLRVYRESIYYAEVLFFLAAAVGALFFATGTKQKLWYAALAGVVLGWLWLTREEGVWILPALTILVGAAALRAYRDRQTRQFVWTLLTVIFVFAATQVGFRSVNWWVYGTFVGVDFKERNYQRALAAIHSVRSGGVVPSISITKKAREYVYAVSPSFASLKDYLDGPAGDGWAIVSCNTMKAGCPEIGAGWFIFALRHAAASRGHYATPAKASAFFGQLADEIDAACANGLLACEYQLIGEIPAWTWQEIWERLPSYIAVASKMSLFLNPPLQISPSGDNEAALGPRLRFLNYPLHTNPVGASLVSYSLSGWYYAGGSNWFTASIKDVDGSIVQTRLRRNGSPDIQAGFKDPEASQQRFVLETTCVNECVLQLQTPKGAIVEKRLAEFLHPPYGFIIEGFGQMHVEVAMVQGNANYIVYRMEDLCRRFREFLMTNYQFVFLPVLGIGVLAFLVASFLCWKQVILNVCYTLALVSWLLALSRVGLLGVMGITLNSTIPINPYYGAPMFFHLVCGAVFSIAACAQLLDFQSTRASRLIGSS
jgi:hypothetical protein